MQSLKIGVQLAGLRLPFRKALGVAAHMGAQAVEIDARGELQPGSLSATGLREVRRLLEEHGLAVAAVAFRTRRGYDTSDGLQRRIEATKGALSFAYSLGAPVVVNQVGRVPVESKGPDWELLVQSLTDLSAYGLRVGALLAAQTGDEPGADLARLLAALPERGIGIDLDPAELILHGFSPQEAVGALGPHVLHVHARDAVRDLARRATVEVDLGRGMADFPALLAALEEHNYRGCVTAAREQADDAAAKIGQAVTYLKNLIAGMR